MRVRVLPYNQGSRTARLIAEGLGVRRLRLENSRFSPRTSDTIVNWGCSNPPLYRTPNSWLNEPHNVLCAKNKYRAFQQMNSQGVRVPPFTTDREAAHQWNFPVIVRSNMTGHGGQDATYYSEGELPYAPLYVGYIKKFREYRIHVMGNTLLDVQQKCKQRDVPENQADFKIRNHSRGWIFSRFDILYPVDDVINQAINAVQSLGLSFGAVDVVWNHHYQQAYVLEVNCAPGLEATTLNQYIQNLREIIWNE